MKITDRTRRYANAAAKLWLFNKDEHGSPTLEWWLAFKLGLEKRRDVDQLARVVREWRSSGAHGVPFSALDDGGAK